jgi:DNA-binding response OmpR family regulator
MPEPISVLVIEDEPLIAMMLEDFVDLLGYRLSGTADSVADALGQVRGGNFDVAILDVHLRDGACWPVADALHAAGKPFVLATGGHTEAPPAAHANAPTLGKPFTMDGVGDAISGLVA